MYGLSADEAREVCQRPLPYPDDLKQRSGAAQRAASSPTSPSELALSRDVRFRGIADSRAVAVDHIDSWSEA
jgi:hypothetical protein